jgi:hypothetical protein
MLSVVHLLPDPVKRICRCSSSDVFLKSFAFVHTVFACTIAAHRTAVGFYTHTVMLLHLFDHLYWCTYKHIYIKESATETDTVFAFKLKCDYWLPKADLEIQNIGYLHVHRYLRCL